MRADWRVEFTGRILLLGHGRDGWWTGTSLDIQQARSPVPWQNATTLQVATSALGALR
ncbi:homospermidine synthase [Actinopolyspora alba]|uniref:Homospermidine synthase n=1 Tax=Actinopolyspora alba TaxID=673379 RepID=A0A1I2BRR8_9ACTN|nr:hypothetical protein [Actinopolyspora alba]SFE57960.1 homospermidine synthase [Actinopolyspora alba]